MKISACLLVVGLLVASGRLARAQTTPPINTVNETRPDFSGTWVLDRSISTDPAQIRLGSFTSAPRQENRGGLGRFGSGGGRRQGGGNAGNRSGAEVLTPVEQSRLDALTNQLKTSVTTLVISHHDPSFVVADAKDQAQFFQIGGASAENIVGVETLIASAHWDGSRIVAEYVLGDRRTVTYTYTLVPRTKQLVLRVARNGNGLPRATEPEVKLVYKLAPSQPTGSERGQ